MRKLYLYFIILFCIQTNISNAQEVVDTFFVANLKFRLTKQAYLFQVDYYTKNGWSRNFNPAISQWSYDNTTDVNNDGYVDFLVNNKWTYDVYLFNPLKKRFSTSVNCTINSEWQILDSVANIFCEYQPFNYVSSTITSDLYTFKASKKIPLFKIEFTRYHNGYCYTYRTKASVYKYLPTGQKLKIRTINFPKSIQGTEPDYTFDFDYKQFWKENYKVLQGYR